METTPYPNFWKEEPQHQATAWRPTDQSKQKLHRFWIVQCLLVCAIAGMAVMIAHESKKTPPIMAQLPNGLVFETSSTPLELDRLARTEMINDILPVLYYQEAGENRLPTVKNNVRLSILSRIAGLMQGANNQTNATARLDIIETFETMAAESKSRMWFEAMTKGDLVRQDKRSRNEANVYIRSHWEYENGRFVLNGMVECKPSEYNEAFLAEKQRLHSMRPEDLQRELNVRPDISIPLPERKSNKL
jgi:hypothetical protein